MANKKEKLIKRATETTRQPNPSRLREEGTKKGYKVLTISLYTPEINWVNQTVKSLQQSGHPKANRSLVIREAILRLQEQLKEKNPDEIVKDLIEQQAKRGNT